MIYATHQADAYDTPEQLDEAIVSRAGGFLRCSWKGGSIDPDLWNCYTPYGTNAWLLDGHEERQIEDERFGYC